MFFFLWRFVVNQEDAKRAAHEAHRTFAAYEGDLPTLLNVYEGFLKVTFHLPARRYWVGNTTVRYWAWELVEGRDE